MDLAEIKKIVEKLGSAVIVEPDGSKFILMTYEKCLDLMENSSEEGVRLNLHRPASGNGSAAVFSAGPARQGQLDQGVIERLNEDIAILKEEIKRKELAELEQELIVD